MRDLSLWCTDSPVGVQGLCCSTACGILVPRGLNPRPLHCRVDSKPPDHRGSPDPGILLTLCDLGCVPFPLWGSMCPSRRGRALPALLWFSFKAAWQKQQGRRPDVTHQPRAPICCSDASSVSVVRLPPLFLILCLYTMFFLSPCFFRSLSVSLLFFFPFFKESGICISVLCFCFLLSRRFVLWLSLNFSWIFG